MSAIQVCRQCGARWFTCDCRDAVMEERELAPATGSVKRTIAPAATSTIELLYNGDYPGYRVIRVNGRWLNEEQVAFLLSLFPVERGETGLAQLFDLCGARKIPESVEHYPFDGTMTISISQNTEVSDRAGNGGRA